MMKKILLGLVAVSSLATAANAVTTITLGKSAGTLYTDFTTPANLSGTYTITSTSTVDKSLKPLGGTGNYLAVGAKQSATLSLGAGTKEVSFLWGSIDSFNHVSFYSGTTLISTFSGNALKAYGATTSGSGTSTKSNKLVDFDFGATTITSIKFTSTKPSFEVDNVSIGAVVPEPATWAMLIAGFSLVGVSARRRRDRTVSVSA